MKEFLKRLSAIAFGIVLSVGLAEGGARLLFPSWKDFSSDRFLATADLPGFGATPIGRKGFDGYFAQNDGDFRVRVRIDDLGFRNDPGSPRPDGAVWAVGDSFTFGWGVDVGQRFGDVAGHLAGRPVFNAGSPGGDVCAYQALTNLLLERGKPAAVVVGLTLENDINDYDCGRPAGDAGEAVPLHFISWKGLLLQHSALYNLVALSLKRSAAVRSALISLGLVAAPNEDRRTVARTDFDAMTASTAMEVARLQIALPKGTPFAVAVIPGRPELIDRCPYYHDLRVAMVRALEAHGIAVIDLFAALKNEPFAKTHFAHDGHWSSEGHKIAGGAVARWLMSWPMPNAGQ